MSLSLLGVTLVLGDVHRHWLLQKCATQGLAPSVMPEPSWVSGVHEIAGGQLRRSMVWRGRILPVRWWAEVDAQSGRIIEVGWIQYLVVSPTRPVPDPPETGSVTYLRILILIALFDLGRRVVVHRNGACPRLPGVRR